jgi:cell division protease FtsH
MVRELGLSPTIGPVGYPEGGSVFPGGGGPGMSSRPFAESTQAQIDSDVARLLREAEERAIVLLRAHQAELRRVVDLLLEQETVDGAAVYRVLGTAGTAREPAVLVSPARGDGQPGGHQRRVPRGRPQAGRARCLPTGRRALGHQAR